MLPLDDGEIIRLTKSTLQKGWNKFSPPPPAKKGSLKSHGHNGSGITGRKREVIEKAVIRFCGDSGDGMQITGSQFTNTVALYGNDLATLPDFPAEIRAPAGTLPGVSGFQVHFSSSDVYTPGDSVDALIAMNPAALKMNLAGPEN